MTEAVGKILGMVMAYGVSSLGLFLAYVNYRRRTVGADKVMTGRAWMVIGMVVLAVAGGVEVVTRLAEVPPSAEPVEVEAAASTEHATARPASNPAPATDEQRDEWPLVGMLLPALIFLFATWITTSLHRHFSAPGHEGAPQSPQSVGD